MITPLTSGSPAAPAELYQATLDAMDAAVVLFDAHARLVLCNRSFRTLYAGLDDLIEAGVSLETLLRGAIARGLLPEGEVDVERFVADRLARHASPGEPIRRRLPDGRWRRISEQGLADGSVLAYSIDITELVEKKRALEAAQREAQDVRDRLEDAVEATPAGIEIYDAQDRLVLANTMLRDLYPHISARMQPGARFEDLLRANIAAGGLSGVNEGDEAWVAARLARRRTPGEPHEGQLASGRWIRTHERRMRDGGLVGVRIDVTELLQQRASAQRAAEQLNEAVEALPDGFALYDADDRLVVCNHRYRELYAVSAAAIVPGTSFETILRYGLTRGQYPGASGEQEAWLAERLYRHRHPGEPVLQELPGNCWLRIDERLTRDGGVAGVRADVTELVRREQQLQRLNAQLAESRAQLAQLSETDALTGIANRRCFDRRLEEEWQRSARHGLPLALILVDVDHFKRYNDAIGHRRGDDCLRQVAVLLQDGARRAGDLAARYGGEEFALLLPHTTAEDAMAVAQACLNAVTQAGIAHPDSPVASHVTLSLGVASTVGSQERGAEALVEAADAAVYLAKRAGRARAVAAS